MSQANDDVADALMWYVATLVIQSHVAGRVERFTLVDEQLRVLRAPNDEAAYEKAMLLGKQDECSYENSYGEMAHWEFVGLAELEELSSDEIADGTEIKYRLLRKKDPLRLVLSKDKLALFKYANRQDATLHPTGLNSEQ